MELMDCLRIVLVSFGPGRAERQDNFQSPVTEQLARSVGEPGGASYRIFVRWVFALQMPKLRRGRFRMHRIKLLSQ